jgi:hypothetical protein
MVRAPVLLPVAVGVKVTLMAQLAPGAMLGPQEFAWVKSPLAVMLPRTSAAVEWFVTFIVTVVAGLEVPTFWPGKVKLPGEKATLVPGPARLII